MSIEAEMVASLDDGIRDRVVALRSAGFKTTDSGDGSKAEWMEGAMPFPNVAATCAPGDLLAEADRMVAVLAAFPGATVEATYLPESGHAILLALWYPSA